MEHWFWLGLVSLTLLWYVVVTVFVAIRGSGDIRRMLEEFKHGSD
ncbi:MAG: hypothetical protein OEQ53_15250 [Saprospiraceae bacterium]|nr:hypothetical protein [Saprospiraceae bacterium]